MLVHPTVHSESATVGELREFFRNDHVHVALLVAGRRLVSVVERSDLEGCADELSARTVGIRGGRTVSPDTPLSSALEILRKTVRRRLVVVDRRGELVGLLCLKGHGLGFCSDEDVAQRRLGVGEWPGERAWIVEKRSRATAT